MGCERGTNPYCIRLKRLKKGGDSSGDTWDDSKNIVGDKNG